MDDEWVLVRAPDEPDVASWLAAGGDAGAEEERPLKVVFAAPAAHWTDAAPIGNGRLGGMIWGGVASETIQLNHDTLWTGVPGDYTNPDASEVLQKVRKLVDDGDYATATETAKNMLGSSPDAYQPLGDMNIEFGDSSDTVAYTDYIREIDLRTATVNVKYTVGNVEFTREHFSSNPHQVLVTRISSNLAGGLSFTVSLDSKLHHHTVAKAYNQIIMEGSCPGPRGNESENPSGIKFAAALNLQVGNGKVQELENKKLKVVGSDWAVLLLAASSSFQDPFTKPSDSKKDPSSECWDIINKTKNMSYTQLHAYHLDDYQGLFNRLTLQLSKDPLNISEKQSSSIPDEPHICRSILGDYDDSEGRMSKPIQSVSSTISAADRVKSFKNDEDPSFVELLFHYGRYLLISSSRPGTQVSNLQGIWNKDTQPAWSAAPHMNINLQMNYWPSLTCNLRECQEPLFDFIASLAVNGSKTAKDNYDASGWVAHQVTDLWAKTSPDEGDPLWALWPMGGAWLCTHLWEHYLFTMDKSFLKNKAYPLLEGCASFLLDWLIEGRGGLLETNPSTSPEHKFTAPDGKPASVSYSSTMDMAIIKEVFSAIISSAHVLGKSDSSLVVRIKSALSRLPPYKIDRDGSLMEWAQDFEDPEVHHRHVSHLFGLFPGHSISIEKTPDLCKAVDNSLFKRGDAGPGWSSTWKMALWSHLHNSEHAYTMVKQLINLVDPDHEADYEGGLYSNLFTAHPPFQIDANFGFTAAIAEMLVQSTAHDLYLLPALPRDRWPYGCAKGLKARGGATVNICWKKGELHQFWLLSRTQNSTRLHYNGKVITVSLSSSIIYKFNQNLKCLKRCPLPEGVL